MSRKRDVPVIESEPVGTHLPVLAHQKGKNRPKVPKPVRRAVYERDGHRCVYCGSGNDLTIDHKKPLGRGGKNTMANMVTACESCNQVKADGKAPPMLHRRKGKKR